MVSVYRSLLIRVCKFTSCLICVLYSDSFLFIGWLGIVKSNQLHHTVCQSLDDIFKYKLNIKCNTDEIVYVINQLSVNSLGTYYGYTVKRDTECHNTAYSVCFRTITSDLSSAYTSKVTLSCNEKHSCTLEFSDFNSSVRIFTTSCECCTNHLYHIRVGVSFECLPCKYFNNLMYCFPTHANYLSYKHKKFHWPFNMNF